ncbi:MAG: GNAT family acetyltransferase, partial [Verrucomicrobiales bacterium]
MAAILSYDDTRHRAAVVELWGTVFGYTSSRNEPNLVIDKKLQEADGLFRVAESEGGELLGTVMGGYDGHRGWIYSLAVTPPAQGAGVGRALMRDLEAALVERGCLKINLQVLEGNRGVVEFYGKLGYVPEPRISMGKTIDQNIP